MTAQCAACSFSTNEKIKTLLYTETTPTKSTHSSSLYQDINASLGSLLWDFSNAFDLGYANILRMHVAH